VANENVWAGRHFSNPCILESTIYDSIGLAVFGLLILNGHEAGVIEVPLSGS
jgi:hypothetical protein